MHSDTGKNSNFEYFIFGHKTNQLYITHKTEYRFTS
jgi:hypothetical protein